MAKKTTSLSNEELKKIRIRAIIRREEQRKLELTYNMVSTNMPINVVGNTYACKNLEYRYPNATYKHWLVFFSIIYVSARVEEVIGAPYFIHHLANRWLDLQTVWRKTDYFGYWQRHGAIVSDPNLWTRLRRKGHPWAELKKKNWTPYYVHRPVVEKILADYAEELAAFYEAAASDIENTPHTNITSDGNQGKIERKRARFTLHKINRRIIHTDADQVDKTWVYAGDYQNVRAHFADGSGDTENSNKKDSGGE